MNSHETLLETLSTHGREEEWFRSQDLEYLTPLEVDDEYISEDEILSQPEDKTPVTAGLSMLSRMYYLAISATLHVKVEMQATISPSTADEPQDIDRRNVVTKLATLKETFQKVKYLSDEVNQDFNEWPKSVESSSSCEASHSSQGPLIRQFEIMRANILVSRLWLQSVILEEIVALSTRNMTKAELQGDWEEQIQVLWNEREDICRQLLYTLRNFSYADLEPNGASLVCAVTHLNTCPLTTQKTPF